MDPGGNRRPLDHRVVQLPSQPLLIHILGDAPEQVGHRGGHVAGCASIRVERGQPIEGGLGRVVGDSGLEADLDRDLRGWGEHDVIVEQALVGDSMFDDRVREQVAERVEQLGAGERSAHHVSSDAAHALDLDAVVVCELSTHALAAGVLQTGQHPRGHLDAVDRYGAHPTPLCERRWRPPFNEAAGAVGTSRPGSVLVSECW